MPTTHCGFPDQPNELIRYGPTLYVDIGFDASFIPAEGSVPNLQAKLLPALVDTGAMESCIDSALAQVLNLPIVNRRNVSGAHGAAPVNVHLAHIYVPSLNHTIYGQFAGVHLTAGGQPHTALIGRTFLQRFTMTYNGATGDVVLER